MPLHNLSKPMRLVIRGVIAFIREGSEVENNTRLLKLFLKHRHNPKIVAAWLRPDDVPALNRDAQALPK